MLPFLYYPRLSVDMKSGRFCDLCRKEIAQRDSSHIKIEPTTIHIELTYQLYEVCKECTNKIKKYIPK